MTSIAVPQVWQPSNARRVALDGLLPLPRGALPSDVPPLVWPAKDPADVLDYALDASAALAGDPSDRVVTVGVVIVPNLSPADLQLGSVVADGGVATMWLSGGQIGIVYSVQITLSTLHGRIIGRSVLLPVLQIATAAPPTNMLTTAAGAVITDLNGNPILVGS